MGTKEAGWSPGSVKKRETEVDKMGSDEGKKLLLNDFHLPKPS